MTFAKQLEAYTAAQIIAAIRCPRGTAYDWKNGRREPPRWQRVHWLKLIETEAKNPNKTAYPTPRTLVFCEVVI